jgi:voltage-gated potassium channel
MTKKPYFELSKKARRRLAVGSVLRSVTVATLLVVIYYALPLDAPLGIDTFLDFGLGVLVFAGVVIWQVRAIGRSEVPRLRALQTVTSGVTLLLVLYAALYSAISYGQPDGFNQALSRTDSLYFTVTVFSTVGFGDIAPTSELARIVTMTQMLFGLLTFGLIARTLLSAVDVAVRRRESERPQPPTAAESNDR